MNSVSCVICKVKPALYSDRCTECYAALVSGEERRFCPSEYEGFRCGLLEGHGGDHRLPENLSR